MDPKTLTSVIGLAQSVTDVMNSGLEIYLERARTEAKDRDRRENLAATAEESEKDRELARELYLRGRRDQREDAVRSEKAARDTELFRAELEHYPIETGPGQLRESLNLAADPSAMLPLVLLTPASRDSDKAWRQLSRRMSNSLMYLQAEELADVIQADRYFSWPHSALVEHDLREVPTIVTSVEVVTGMISVKIGGCYLGGERAVRKLHQVAYLPLPDAAYWTPARLAALENTSMSGFRRPASPEEPAGLETLQMEWVTRLAIVAVVAAVDSYHLLRRRGYAERLDDAASMLMPDLADGLNIDISPTALADPAYHLLHQARRQVANGEPEVAARTVTGALQILSGQPDADPAEALQTAISEKRLEDWHRDFLARLIEDYPKAGLLDRVSMKILTSPVPDPRDTAGTLERRPSEQHPYIGRTVPITRDTPPDSIPSKW